MRVAVSVIALAVMLAVSQSSALSIKQLLAKRLLARRGGGGWEATSTTQATVTSTAAASSDLETYFTYLYSLMMNGEDISDDDKAVICTMMSDVVLDKDTVMAGVDFAFDNTDIDLDGVLSTTELETTEAVFDTIMDIVAECTAYGKK